MNEEVEQLLKEQPLKKPSQELDSRIFDMLEKASEPSIYVFPWRKVITYAAAAMLFLAVGISEYLKRGATVADTVVTLPEVKKGTTASPASPTINVSTTQDSFVRGRLIKLDDGRLVRPIIRRVIIRKRYFDKAKNVEVFVEEPHQEVFYVPLQDE